MMRQKNITYKTTISITIDPDLVRKVDKVRQELGLSRSFFIRESLESFINIIESEKMLQSLK